jgi:hypothetical protein
MKCPRCKTELEVYEEEDFNHTDSQYYPPIKKLREVKL